MKSSIKKCYTLIWGQTFEVLREKIKSRVEYEDIRKENNTIKLVKIMREVIFKFEDKTFWLRLFKMQRNKFIISVSILK